MLIRWLLFLVALMAHFWLWGRWSFEESLRSTLLLVVTSGLLLVIVVLPLRALFKNKNPKSLWQSYWMRGCFYTYIALIIVMSLFHFTGLIKILLPIKVALLAASVYLKYKWKALQETQRY